MFLTKGTTCDSTSAYHSRSFLNLSKHWRCIYCLRFQINWLCYDRFQWILKDFIPFWLEFITILLHWWKYQKIIGSNKSRLVQPYSQTWTNAFDCLKSRRKSSSNAGLHGYIHQCKNRIVGVFHLHLRLESTTATGTGNMWRTFLEDHLKSAHCWTRKLSRLADNDSTWHSKHSLEDCAWKWNSDPYLRDPMFHLKPGRPAEDSLMMLLRHVTVDLKISCLHLWNLK